MNWTLNKIPSTFASSLFLFFATVGAFTFGDFFFSDLEELEWSGNKQSWFKTTTISSARTLFIKYIPCSRTSIQWWITDDVKNVVKTKEAHEEQASVSLNAITPFWRDVTEQAHGNTESIRFIWQRGKKY